MEKDSTVTSVRPPVGTSSRLQNCGSTRWTSMGSPRKSCRGVAIQVVSCVYCGEALLRGYEAHVKKRHPDELDQWLAENTGSPTRSGTINKIPSLTLRVQPDGSNNKELVGGVRSTLPIPRSYMTDCPECSKAVRIRSLRHHLKTVHGIGGPVEMFKCDECGKEFSERGRMVKHVRYQHQFDEIDDRLEVKGLVKFDRSGRQVDCLVCNNNKTIKILTPDSLRAHFVAEHHLLLLDLLQSSSSTEPLFPCDHCSQKFPSRKERHAHVRDAHPDYDPPPARAPRLGRIRPSRRFPGICKKVGELSALKTPCLKCGMGVTLRGMARHLRDKHGEKDSRFVCEYCNKSFRWRDYHVCHLEVVHQVPRDQLVVVPSKEELAMSTEGQEGRYRYLKKNHHHHHHHQLKKKHRCGGRRRKSTKSAVAPMAEAEEEPQEQQKLLLQSFEIGKGRRLVIKVVRLTREEIDGDVGGVY